MTVPGCQLVAVGHWYRQCWTERVLAFEPDFTLVFYLRLALRFRVSGSGLGA